jgi:hypothetical protein
MDERSRLMAKRFEVPILIAALLVIPVIVIEEANVSDTWRTIGEAGTRKRQCGRICPTLEAHFAPHERVGRSTRAA